MIASHNSHTSHLSHQAPCDHGLVETGQPCPECLCHSVRPHGVSYMSQAHLQARLVPYLAACRAACPRELLPQLEARIAEGNWYGLQFIRRLRSGAISQESAA